MKYDYQDADGYERGIMTKKPNVKRIYKLRWIDRETKLAHVSSMDCWSGIHNEVFPVHTLTPLDLVIHRYS